MIVDSIFPVFSFQNLVTANALFQDTALLQDTSVRPVLAPIRQGICSEKTQHSCSRPSGLSGSFLEPGVQKHPNKDHRPANPDPNYRQLFEK